MLCVSSVTPDYGMADSHVAQFTINLSGSLPKCSQKAKMLCNLENHSAFEEEFEREDSFKTEVSNSSGNVRRLDASDKSKDTRLYRLKLEEDVQALRQQLHEEMELQSVLQDSIKHAAVTLSCLSCLPYDVQELLSNIATLEGSVSQLEQQMVSLHFQLSQERNERRLVEYRMKQSSFQSLYLCSNNGETQVSSSHGTSENALLKLQHTSEDVSHQDRRDLPCDTSSRTSSTGSVAESVVDHSTFVQGKVRSMQVLQHEAVGKLNKDMPIRDLWNYPNQLSEEMVRCMKNIFISLADSSNVSCKSSMLDGLNSSLSPRGHLSNLSLWSHSESSVVESWKRSPQVDVQCNGDVLASENVFDPYRVSGKLSWADFGNYGLAVEVSWMSVGRKQLEYAAGALRRFKLLVEQLAKVNPAHLNNKEKLAFWINLYNALIMHAFLAYGVPRSDLKLFSLMQKAAYTVGGHSFNATTIEYQILKMRPPLHRPQTALLLALHKLKTSEEQTKFSIDCSEPLVAFALSCGMYSSPAVRIYTAGNIMEELQEAQHDFIRASVGVTRKGKLLVPKMLHCFARGFVDDANLAVWISQFLPPQQAAFVEQCISKRSKTFLGSRNCGIVAFDSRFRYLFLQEVLL
ncbi:hypothetical protein AAC387_Pa07g0299 [Persea americana]